MLNWSEYLVCVATLIRMVLLGCHKIALLDLSSCRIPVDTQRFVVFVVLHWSLADSRS